MYRCLELAKHGAGHVAPNPMVGAVLVYGNRIIGEGYHQQYGQAHAEVNCVNSVREADKHLVPLSTIYVSLEPCAHFGKTPPCADLIIREGIRKVIVGCRDPFKQVDGKGIEKLQKAGVGVTVGMLEQQCQTLNQRFFHFHTQHRPYIVLKWAQTADHKINGKPGSRLLISNDYSNRLVHRWRSEEAAILVATNTALQDDPKLNNRLWTGNNPIRLVIDMNLRLPASLQLFNERQPTIVFNKHQHTLEPGIKAEQLLRDNITGYYQVTEDVSIVQQVVNACYQMSIQSMLVEGGARLLQSFIEEDTWDEARVITNERLLAGEGIASPMLTGAELTSSVTFFNDRINYYTPKR